jgi:hypothetical protein
MQLWTDHCITSSKCFPNSQFALPLLKLQSIWWITVSLPNYQLSKVLLNEYSSFAVNLPTPTKDITIEGQPKIHSDIAMSGNTADRHFCSDCGSYVLNSDFCATLTFRSPIMTVIRQRPEISVLKGGLFAKFGVDLPAPGREQFWRRAEKWEKPHEGVTTLVE